MNNNNKKELLLEPAHVVALMLIATEEDRDASSQRLQEEVDRVFTDLWGLGLVVLDEETDCYELTREGRMAIQARAAEGYYSSDGERKGEKWLN